MVSPALRGLRRNSVDLVVLDIKMPRIDGIEVLKRLRKWSDLPVIFLTSKDDEVDEICGLRMGADDYVTKPFSQRLTDRAHSHYVASFRGYRQKCGRS